MCVCVVCVVCVCVCLCVCVFVCVCVCVGGGGGGGVKCRFDGLWLESLFTPLCCVAPVTVIYLARIQICRKVLPV